MDYIPKEKLRIVGKILEETPAPLSRDHLCKEEYWRQFIDALPQRIYSNAKIEEFADERCAPLGPGLTLLVDLTVRGLDYETFLDCLKEIKCYKALNLFIQSTVPVITQQPESQAISRGDTLVLSCTATCDPPPPEYQWYLNETLLFGCNAPQLCINDVKANLTGQYRCKVTNKSIDDKSINHVWSSIAEVDIVKFPIQACNDQIMEEQVDFNGMSSPFTTFSTSNSSIPNSSIPNSSIPNSIPIDRTTSNDSMTSASSLMSRIGSDSAAATPVGYGKKPIAESTPAPLPSPLPIHDITITKPLPEKVEWKYLQSFSLECQAKSASGKNMTFTWILKKRNKVLQTLKKENSLFSSSLTHKWTETDNWSANDNILVICEVTHTDESSSEKQESKSKLKFITVWITEHPKPINGVINDEAVLSCRAKGKEKIAYSLFHSNNCDKLGDCVAGENDHGNFTIKLEGAAWGYYACQAGNGDHHVTSDSVLVKFGTSRQKLLSISVQPLSMVCEKGKEASLVCRAEPEQCHYQWYFNGNPMVSYPSVDTKTNRLVIPSVNDSHFGRYHCKIEYKGQTQVTNEVSLYPRNMKDKGGARNPTQQNQYYAELAFTTEDKVKYAREKVALLIGNQEYQHANKLTSPYNDVIKLKEALIKMGFKIFAYFDLQFDETMSAIQKISGLLGSGVYLFFYYSGHGFRYEKHQTDYIMPVEAELDPLKCTHCISSTYITNEFQKTQSKVFTFFDCCRASYQADKVLGPTSDPLKPEAYSNLLKVLSCSASRSAYERKSAACSVFNKALCEGLEMKLNAVKDLAAHISEVMQKEGESKKDSESQRSESIGRMLPTHITLHEEIMRESWKNPPFEAEQYTNMYIEESKSWPLEHMIADVRFTFVALNHLKVTIKMVSSVGQCKGMDVELTAVGDEDEHHPEKIPKDDKNESLDVVFNVTGIQKFSKSLKLVMKFTMISSTEERAETSKEITFPLREVNIN